MPARTRRRGTLWPVLAALAPAACIFGLGLILRLKGLPTAANVAQLISVLPVLAAAMQPLQAWRRERRRAPVVSPEDLTGAQEHLAMLLREQWRTESQLRALDDPDPIPVRWRLTNRAELIDIPANRTADVLIVASSDDLAGLVEDFRRLRRRRLVILGDAGAGKTTLAVQILLELLRTRDQHPGEPVPVLLSLASWDTWGGQLREWVAGRIAHDYPELSAAGFGTHVVDALAAQGRILPILDGLDETPPAVQDTVIEALNLALDGDAQLIVTSRTEEFSHAVEVANRVLGSAVVIEPEPLTPAAAADYLARCLPPVPDPAWHDILDLLRSGAGAGGTSAALAGIATSPLGLWLLRVGYITPGADPAPLLDDRYATATAMRAHLFDQLIPASVAARPPSDNPTEPFRPRHSYDPGDVDRWLRFLAANLDRENTRDLDWTRDVPSLAAPVRWPAASARLLRRWRPVAMTVLDRVLAYRSWMWLVVLLVLSVTIGTALAVIGEAFSAAGAFLAHPRLDNTVTGLVGLLVVLAVGAALVEGAVLVARPRVALDEFDPVDELAADWYAAGRFLTTAAEMLSLALAYALSTGVVSGVAAGLVTSARTGWWIGLTIGGAVGLSVALGYVADRDRPPGTGRRIPWYGIGPGPGIRSGIARGVGLGALGGLILAGVYLAQVTEEHPITATFMVVTIAAFAGIRAVLRGVLVPVVFTITSPVLAAARAALRRSTSARQDSLALWQEEGIRQRLRLLRALLVTVVVAAGTAVLWLALRDSPDVAALRQSGVRDGLAARLTPFDITWSGQLRYAFAVAIAWVVTVPRTAHRTWRAWLVWLAVAGGVVLLWPVTGWADTFQLRLIGRFEHLDAGLALHAHAHLGGHELTGEVWQAIDLAALVTNRPLRWIELGLLGLVGLLVLEELVGRWESGQPQVWWSVLVSTRWHVARGRLPRDLLVFLDDAHRLGLLRAVGTVYQFRHAELQDHLARSAAPPQPPDPAVFEPEANSRVQPP